MDSDKDKFYIYIAKIRFESEANIEIIIKADSKDSISKKVGLL
jgi:hypothetical protein